MTEWKTIDTAPWGETYFLSLVYVSSVNDDSSPFTIMKRKKNHFIDDHDLIWDEKDILYWTVLPEPPKEKHECRVHEDLCYTDEVGNIILITRRAGELEKRMFCRFCPFCGEKTKDESDILKT